MYNLNVIVNPNGKPLIDVLQRNHPVKKLLLKVDLENYGDQPLFLTLDISQKVVERVSRTMGGGVDPKGVDASRLQIWLKTYRGHNKELREEVALFVE